MGCKKNKFPVPIVRFKSGAWRIRWSCDYVDYEFTTGFPKEKREQSETVLATVALALRTGEWTEELEDVPAVRKWRLKAKAETTAGILSSSSALDGFRSHHAAYSRPEETESRMRPLIALASKYDLLTMTTAQADEYFRSLADKTPSRYLSDKVIAVMGNRIMLRPEIIKAMLNAGIDVDRKRLSTALSNRKIFKLFAEPGHHRTGKYQAISPTRGLAPRTRNKYRISFNMFYKWAIKQGLCTENPFGDVRTVRENKHADIVWLTREERDEATRAAESLPCRVAVWVALYAGLRLGEIVRLQWADIDLAARWIHVKKSKTGKTRRVPVSGALLEAITPAAKKSGFVVPHWQAGKPAVKAESDLRLLGKSLPALVDKLKWNVFRHTFASLLAQTGKVSIDQISALMGNTPEVCRRHYAHLIPDAVERTGIDLID